jgi:GT2 family glycosyltransferase
MGMKPEEELPLVSIVIPTHNRKEKLTRLINSILQSNYPQDKLEIIVVDDASTDGTYEEVRAKFHGKVKIIRNERETLLAASRNIGIKNANGKYIFLIDDDNVIDKNCIKELVKTMIGDPRIGIVGPIMYYYEFPDVIWCAGIKRNMTTSLFTVIGKDMIDNGQFSGKLIESDDFPNAFMIKREVLEKVGLFDEKSFPIHYDEADLGMRVRRAGYRIVCNPKAKVWHDIPLLDKDKASQHYVSNSLRAYYTARNRIIFHKKYSKKLQLLIYITVFNWIIALYYLKIIIFDLSKTPRDRLEIAKAYIKGIVDGIKFHV